MEELTALLNAIDDSYYDFVSAMINYACLLYTSPSPRD